MKTKQYWLNWSQDTCAQAIREEHNVFTNSKGQQEKTNPQILEAFVFWRFLIDEVDVYQNPDLGAEFINDENPYVALIAKLQSLPTIVFRKLLYRHNIDFLSLVSCLRRLTVEQKEAIELNYQDWIEEKTPRVLLMTLRDRIKAKFGMYRFEKLKKEFYQCAQSRYGSKPAWAFNLFGIDFGFALYPKGADDDTEIADKSPGRFFSKKGHVNDFVVNTLDGLYWAFYKFARSNYVYRPNRDVKLNTHVCPGFWYTWGVHLFYWVLSPVASMLVLRHAIDFQNLAWSDSAWIPCFWTLIWILLATIRLGCTWALWILFKLIVSISVFVNKVAPVLHKKFKESKWPNRFKSALQKIKESKAVLVILTILFFLIALLMAIGVLVMILKLCSAIQIPSIFGWGIFLSGLVSVILTFRDNVETWYQFKRAWNSLPKLLRYLMILTVVSFVLAVLNRWVITYLPEMFSFLGVLFTSIGKGIWFALKAIFVITWLPTLMLISLSVAFWFVFLRLDVERIEKALENRKVVKAGSLILLSLPILFLCMAYYKNFTLYGIRWLDIVLVAVFTLGAFGLYLYLSVIYRKNLQSIDEDRAKQILSLSSYVKRVSEANTLLRNEAFMSIVGSSEGNLFLDKVDLLVRRYEKSSSVTREMLLSLSPANIEFLYNSRYLTRNCSLLEQASFAYLLCSGYSMADAHGELRKRRKKEQQQLTVNQVKRKKFNQRIAKLSEVMWRIFQIIIFIPRVILVGIFRLITYVVTVGTGLYKAFNERCPYISDDRKVL